MVRVALVLAAALIAAGLAVLGGWLYLEATACENFCPPHSQKVGGEVLFAFGLLSFFVLLIVALVMLESRPRPPRG